MAYTLCFNIALGAANTGLTLEAQLVDTAGAAVGAAITSGFVEIGGGNYLWYANANIPASHRGGVKFQISPAGALKAFVAINPEDAENVDAKVSTRGTANPGDAMGVSSAGADAILDRTAGVETNRTLRQALRLMLAALCGKINGGGTSTVHIRDTNDTKDRVLATVDINGNRSTVTLDAS